MKKTSVLLIDDHVIFRQGVARLINSEPDLEMKFHCSSVGEALLIVATGLVDVVLLDVNLGPERGTDFLSQARQNGFQGPVLILTAGVSKREEHQLRSYGITGIINKEISAAELADRLRDAVGAPPLPVTEAPAPHEPGPALTPREVMVLRLVVDGLTNKEIAAELQLSEAAVKAAVQQLFRKTGAQTRTRLVSLAFELHREQI